jgi:hypothetical protein
MASASLPLAMLNGETGRTTEVEFQDRHLGPFVTHRLRQLPDGGHLVAGARRFRKGLRPHRVRDLASAEHAPTVHAAAFLHLWAPNRLAWWIAILFVIGSMAFTVGGVGATWPQSVPEELRGAAVLNWIFVTGAIFFTSAAWLQWLEALNHDLAEALDHGAKRRWRWFGWRPRNLGYLASAIQLLGTIMFNFNTLDATLTGFSREAEDLLVWTPNMLGCVCFLVASCFAYAEVSKGPVSISARSVSWWVAIANLLGSVAFQLSALYSFAGPQRTAGGALFWASFYIATGGLCFLVGSYLMIPELFDEETEPNASPST